MHILMHKKNGCTLYYWYIYVTLLLNLFLYANIQVRRLYFTYFLIFFNGAFVISIYHFNIFKTCLKIILLIYHYFFHQSIVEDKSPNNLHGYNCVRAETAIEISGTKLFMPQLAVKSKQRGIFNSKKRKYKQKVILKKLLFNTLIYTNS